MKEVIIEVFFLICGGHVYSLILRVFRDDTKEKKEHMQAQVETRSEIAQQNTLFIFPIFLNEK